MKVLVTGAAGFIGSKACENFLKLGHEVTAVDNFNDFYSKSLKYARVENLLKPLGLEVQHLDISKENSIHELITIEEPDSILHLAAQAGVRLPVNQIHKYVQSNLVGFSNVVSAVVQHEVPNFVYASSSSVYGSSQNIPFHEKDLALQPISFYGATKMANELMTSSLVRNSKTKARALRIFTAYGPWGRPDMAYFRLINAAINKSQFELFGDGNVIRDFTYIDDVIDSITKLISDLDNRDFGFNDIVNIAGGKPTSINEMILEISSQLDEVISIKSSRMQENDMIVTEADTSYLKSIISDVPKTQLHEGLSNVVNWAKSREARDNLQYWAKSTN
jgi:UDP-glucuronate 4-epimerase